jgi:endonuclease/exonuclease/phosphatase family metal-dependent hydrolase
LAPGLSLALLGWTRRRKALATGVAALWLLYALVFVEEVSCLTRWPRWPSPEWQMAHQKGAAMRVVSLNCSGDEKAFAEVGSYHPDVVLLQESPGRLKVRAMADAVVGPGADTLLGGDVSIVVRGKLTPVPAPTLGNVAFTHAHVQLASGLKVDVICVRLRPYDPRIDLWSPACWRTQRSIRQQQRWQIEQLLDRIRSIPDTVSLIVGGDFNLPAHDRMLQALRPRLRDTFKERGRGWGNTMDNDIPFLRIDQIWCSDPFRAASVVTRHTLHTDHRMVVGDLQGGGELAPTAR